MAMDDHFVGYLKAILYSGTVRWVTIPFFRNISIVSIVHAQVVSSVQDVPAAWDEV